MCNLLNASDLEPHEPLIGLNHSLPHKRIFFLLISMCNVYIFGGCASRHNLRVLSLIASM